MNARTVVASLTRRSSSASTATRSFHRFSKAHLSVSRQYSPLQILLNNGIITTNNIISITPPSTSTQSYSTTSLVQQASPTTENLLDLLDREIQDETGDGEPDIDTSNDHDVNDDDVPMPDELQHLMDSLSNNWTILDSNNLSPFFSSQASSYVQPATIRMVKKGGIGSDGGGSVVITFHCQDTIPMNPENMEYEDQDEEAIAEEMERSPPFKFHVQVSKRGMNTVFSCISQNAEASLHAIAITLDNDEDNGNSNSGDTAKTTLTPMELQSNPQVMNGYHGPDLSELPQDVIEALQEYLRVDCGVDENVAAFIAMYADYTEQKCYVAWLRGMKELIR